MEHTELDQKLLSESTIIKRHDEELSRLDQQGQEIIHDLSELKAGQSDIEERLDKGASRMDGIEGKVDDMAGEIKELKVMVTKQHSDILGAIKSKENEQLISEVKALRDEKKMIKGRIWDVGMRVFNGILVVVTAGILIALNWK